jgi:putative endonuclease
MKSKNKATGELGEQLAAEFLLAKGWEICNRNWKCPPWEIDLVVQKQGMMIFAEVKTMEFSYVLSPTQKINRTKFRALMRGAEAYLRQHDFEGEIRFDLIYVLLRAHPPEIIHYEDIWFPNNWGR